ncbi:hypothetical protein D3C77_380960 [compost metagenome]
MWGQTLFIVAQAMENKQYTEIVSAMQHIEQANANVAASAVIDDTNVYITLSDGNHSKYVILPRIPQKMGVWTNA